jgi:hypothetical protein
MQALLIAPVSGSYTFAVSSDDNSQLYMSTDENPANKTLIASVGTWTSSREFQKEGTQISAARTLVAGQRYYMEVLQAEGGGGDNLAVTWQRPGDPAIVNANIPIPATNCIPYGLGVPQITTQPTNTIVVEGGTANFTFALARSVGCTFQWTRGGTNIPGANSQSYSLTGLTLASSGSQFRCYITNAYGSSPSPSAPTPSRPPSPASATLAIRRVWRSITPSRSRRPRRGTKTTTP